QLEGDRLAHADVDGLVDLSHPARPDLLDQRVAVAEALAGLDAGQAEAPRGRPRDGRGGGGIGGGGGGDGTAGRAVPVRAQLGATGWAAHESTLDCGTADLERRSGEVAGAYVRAHRPSTYLRRAGDGCSRRRGRGRARCVSGHFEDEHGGADLDLVAGGEEGLVHRPPVDEDAPVVAQALQ